MKATTFKWFDVLSVALLVATLVLLILTFASSDQSLFSNVGWHKLVSVGWVT